TVAGVGIDDKSINPAEDVDIGLFSEAEAYENPKFQRFVTRCTWHVAETYVEHEHEAVESKTPQVFQPSVNGFPINLPPPIKPPNIGATSQVSPPESPNPFLIHIIKFLTVLRTCAHVTAHTCLTAPNLAASLLAACLIPSLNQCVNPTAGTPPIIGPSIVPLNDLRHKG
ncbi:nodulin-23-like, partial [Glycine soja]|uniref:nodulin-23-like n=1 Tax=Glycine soja TaxID=3848 RepID=UPI00103B1834